jgi:hypothetical protein
MVVSSPELMLVLDQPSAPPRDHGRVGARLGFHRAQHVAS